MTRFGTIIRNNAQLMLHTHLKIVTGKIYDKDERYIILHGYHYRYYNFIKYTQKQIDVYKKEKLPPKENSISFYLIRFFSIILPYSVQ